MDFITLEGSLNIGLQLERENAVSGTNAVEFIFNIKQKEKRYSDITFLGYKKGTFAMFSSPYEKVSRKPKVDV